MLAAVVTGHPSVVWRPGPTSLPSTSLLFAEPARGCTPDCDRDITGDIKALLTSTAANMTSTAQCSARLADLNKPPVGFLLVANNPVLGSWATPQWLDEDWVVVRFNHCAVRWPDVCDARHAPSCNASAVQREMIMQRAKSPTQYQGGGDGQLCADALDREVSEDSLALIGGDKCDVPILRVDGHTVSSGSIMALWLLRHFPKSSVVCAGFDQHADDKESGRRFEGHAWGFEERLFPEMQRTGRVHVVNSEEEALGLRVFGSR